MVTAKGWKFRLEIQGWGLVSKNTSQKEWHDSNRRFNRSVGGRGEGPLINLGGREKNNDSTAPMARKPIN